MSINSVDSLAYTKYTSNENPYQACNTGKKVGAAVGATTAAAATVVGLKNGKLLNIANNSLAKVTSGTGKVSKLVAKYPKMFKYGMLGTGLALGTGIVVGLGKLIGHGVDKIVENKRAKEADEQAARLEYLA